MALRARRGAPPHHHVVDAGGPACDGSRAGSHVHLQSAGAAQVNLHVAADTCSVCLGELAGFGVRYRACTAAHDKAHCPPKPMWHAPDRDTSPVPGIVTSAPLMLPVTTTSAVLEGGVVERVV